MEAIALLAAVIGIFFFLDRDGDAALPGIVLALASAITYGCYLTGMDKTPLRNMNPNKVACYMGFTNAMAMALVDIPVGKINYALPPLAMVYTFIVQFVLLFWQSLCCKRGFRIWEPAPQQYSVCLSRFPVCCLDGCFCTKK